VELQAQEFLDGAVVLAVVVVITVRVREQM